MLIRLCIKLCWTKPVVPMGVLSLRVLPYIILLTFLLLFHPDFKYFPDFSFGKRSRLDTPLPIKSFLFYEWYSYFKEHFYNVFQAALDFASIFSCISIFPFLHLLHRKGSYPSTSPIRSCHFFPSVEENSFSLFSIDR